MHRQHIRGLAGVGFFRAGVVEDIIGEAGRLLGVGRDDNEVGVEGGVGVEMGRLMNSPAFSWSTRKVAGLSATSPRTPISSSSSIGSSTS